jgi:hypothetical protein
MGGDSSKILNDLQIFGQGVWNVFNATWAGSATGAGIGAAIGGPLLAPVGLLVGAVAGLFSSAAYETKNITDYLNHSDTLDTNLQQVATREQMTSQLLQSHALTNNDAGSQKIKTMLDLIDRGLSFQGAFTAVGGEHVSKEIHNGGFNGILNRQAGESSINPRHAAFFGSPTMRVALSKVNKNMVGYNSVNDHADGLSRVIGTSIYQNRNPDNFVSTF